MAVPFGACFVVSSDQSATFARQAVLIRFEMIKRTLTTLATIASHEITSRKRKISLGCQLETLCPYGIPLNHRIDSGLVCISENKRSTLTLSRNVVAGRS